MKTKIVLFKLIVNIWIKIFVIIKKKLNGNLLKYDSVIHKSMLCHIIFAFSRVHLTEEFLTKIHMWLASTCGTGKICAKLFSGIDFIWTIIVKTIHWCYIDLVYEKHCPFYLDVPG